MAKNFNQSLKKTRVACFVDGFNFYHAVDALAKDHLKWVNLWGLMRAFIQPDRQELSAVYYFSAIAEYRANKAARHKKYLSVLKEAGVTPILGSFKAKKLECQRCGYSWTGHEEKQTDVNIAIWIVQEAFRNNYDEAFLVSRDSDLVPALRFIREMPRGRRIKIIAPPGLRHSKELAKYADKLATIKEIHLERNLFPETVAREDGSVVAKRPAKYTPPHESN